MEAAAWRVMTNNKDEFNYTLQVDGIKGTRAKNRILKEIDSWENTGEGRGKNKDFVLLFSRTFNDKKSWMRWARSFPYNLVEVTKNGTAKPIKKKRIKS